MMKEIEFTKEEVAAAHEQDGWAKDIAARFGIELGLTMDEVFHFNQDFICRHWPLQPHDMLRGYAGLSANYKGITLQNKAIL